MAGQIFSRALKKVVRVFLGYGLLLILKSWLDFKRRRKLVLSVQPRPLGAQCAQDAGQLRAEHPPRLLRPVPSGRRPDVHPCTALAGALLHLPLQPSVELSVSLWSPGTLPVAGRCGCGHAPGFRWFPWTPWPPGASFGR